MPEVEHFVNNMKQNMETDVMFVTADKTKLITHRQDIGKLHCTDAFVM